MFNRLWIRIALIFVAVQAGFILLPFAVFFTVAQVRPPEDYPVAAELHEMFEEIELTPEQEAVILSRFQRRMRSEIPRDLLQIALFSTVVGSIAGVWVSRRLVKPLNDLEAGADKIGQQQLGFRIDDTVGSSEIQAVARAFNDMAKKLGQAEQVRQNLLADVAHELRTPLTVVQGNLRAILDGVYPLNKEEIAGLYDQTLHLTRLVDDLHELAQAEADQLKLDLDQVDVAELIQACAAAFRPLMDEKGIDLRPELLGKLPTITADRTRLAQALHNLINNGIRHTPENGAITVQGERVGDRLEIRVQDTGDGIDPEHLAYVFDRFYRTDESRQRFSDHTGSGLGLAISRAIVESHGGEMSAESEGLGAGSLFTIRLPV